MQVKSAWLPVAIAIAVALWLVATIIDSRMQSPAPAIPAETAEKVDPAGETGEPPAEPESRLLSCGAFEDRLRLVIDEARSCNVDDDCTLFDYGYPMDCMTSVAKSAIPLLREEYRQYDESCEFRVFYDCPTEPFVRLALCRNQRCVVELDRLDDLRESTLDEMERQQ